MITNATFLWWWALCAAACVNIAAWCVSARYLHAHRHLHDPDVHARRKLLLGLCAIYVLGCAFRSLLPMIDVPRYCLHETWVSRIFLGRTVATVAELSFAAQWVLLLQELGANRDGQRALVAGTAVAVMIVSAEVFSWLAVLTRNNLFHALENSLWTGAAVAAIAGAWALWPRLDDAGKRFVAAAIGCGGAYVAFMATVDVPMYVGRWLHDIQAGTAGRSLLEGLRELIALCEVVRDWAAWREDAVWLTLYFTAAVWISLLLPHAPALAVRRGSGD